MSSFQGVIHSRDKSPGLSCPFFIYMSARYLKSHSSQHCTYATCKISLFGFFPSPKVSSLSCLGLILTFLFFPGNYRWKTLLVLDPEHVKSFEMLNLVQLWQSASARLLQSRSIFFSVSPVQEVFM